LELNTINQKYNIAIYKSRCKGRIIKLEHNYYYIFFEKYIKLL